jgi:hypothetical protein
MDFVARGGGVIAERSAGDTSRKPPLPELYRRDVIDPLSALAAIRAWLRAAPPRPGRGFVLPVYDGARRFDVHGTVLAAGGSEHFIRLRLSLQAIAGFKGETSEDGDPDNAPRPVEVAFTDDARLLPVSMRVSVAYLPLTVSFVRFCAQIDRCRDE